MARLLKRLELNGFKSFAQRTTFDFSGGITAIVGPNGSGKSNIIDAIRWLLGEREAKNLRGLKSEDLIFAGTPSKPRLGQAHASLHFDNQTSFFPVEFPEIAIARQVSRDGTNRYTLNKADIRLKDLIDFFAKARLGTKGLVVISQGNSDVFIQAPPSGRREMIEEMLGLREYQMKKSEALRRLRNTQVNLEKIRALTDEILPHLRSLKRQTGRWEKREALEQELRELENRFFGAEWQELKAKLANVDAAIAGHRDEARTLETEKRRAEDNLKKVEASQPEERKELTVLREKLRGVHEKRSELQKELGRLEATLEAGARSSPAASPPSDGILEFVRKMKERLELVLQDDPITLQEAVQEIVWEINDFLATPALSRKETGSTTASRALGKIQKELEALDEKAESLVEEEKNLEERQEQFYQTFKAAVASVEAAKDKLEKWELANRERFFEHERLGMRREEWERQVRQAGRNPEEFQNLPAAEHMAAGEREAIERRIFKLRGDLASIGEIDEALMKEARETEERYEFLKRESEDTEKAKGDLKTLIADLGEKITTEFGAALSRINEEFQAFFNLMFGGGRAKLKLEAAKPVAAVFTEEPAEAVLGDASSQKPKGKKKEDADMDGLEMDDEHGIEIELKLPRKRITSLDMLSGGERSLVGIAALFALISVSPPPFLVLDEVDAALDDRNAKRFSELLREFAKQTQFILVTHNRATMEAADILYGITMNEDGTSKVLSLRLEKERVEAAATA
ncbi:MAG: hypothetical protein A3A43_00445 [Candidatus Liptonbacteria bacterium RIFCSPLOWO2_01_FULL_56_20]|uniref:AAA+ ATPase domain-containing protein n=1 Tax=Candidatus Liptonbacteria bacterium RIFCSPLOWO2_01_FULL_56_20 TaxID=1798652 RepID=A0A1G2CIN0_9BACT|nr:MAG: Chromosome partition protein Smc [Parcubacteria group bacterium GW2011_GWB1_56_8]OGY98137.1 MAG: hypothetical protein A2681_02830 [Candidatus Liptonbacteria bacterium RIFCSPHIGHO2_01_FULL_56_18b]OGZ01097.1 MAG: hypothetical protein A3A43_00445 [Candidatus Liptonbacteria bacterium RIFCSPLOWO2_01_FULL_56_20]